MLGMRVGGCRDTVDRGDDIQIANSNAQVQLRERLICYINKVIEVICLILTVISTVNTG
jgi:hypothetical protein